MKEKLNLEEKTIVFAATRYNSPMRSFLTFFFERYHVDFLVELLKAFGIVAVGIYGKMDQLSRKDQILKVIYLPGIFLTPISL